MAALARDRIMGSVPDGRSSSITGRARNRLRMLPEPPVGSGAGPVRVDHVKHVAVRIRESDEIVPRLGAPPDGGAESNEPRHILQRLCRIKVQVETVFGQGPLGT